MEERKRAHITETISHGAPLCARAVQTQLEGMGVKMSVDAVRKWKQRQHPHTPWTEAVVQQLCAERQHVQSDAIAPLPLQPPEVPLDTTEDDTRAPVRWYTPQQLRVFLSATPKELKARLRRVRLLNAVDWDEDVRKVDTREALQHARAAGTAIPHSAARCTLYSEYVLSALYYLTGASGRAYARVKIPASLSQLHSAHARVPLPADYPFPSSLSSSSASRSQSASPSHSPRRVPLLSSDHPSSAGV